LRRTVASTGGTLLEVPTRTTKLSQFCHGCGTTRKKPLAQRWHQCACGVGPVQRDLYAAFLAAYLDPAESLPSCAKSCHSPLKVPGWAGRRACGSHTSVSNNVRMRGRFCPEAWVMPVPERVGPKVKANPHQSQLSRSVEEDWKRGRNVRTPAALARGALREDQKGRANMATVPEQAVEWLRGHKGLQCFFSVCNTCPAESVLEVNLFDCSYIGRETRGARRRAEKTCSSYHHLRYTEAVRE
jgi:hypothetical protein